MAHRSIYFLIAGVMLVLAGLACWQAGWDLPLHLWFRLAGASWPPRIVRLSALGGLLVMGPIGLFAMLILFLRGRAGDAL